MRKLFYVITILVSAAFLHTFGTSVAMELDINPLVMDSVLLIGAIAIGGMKLGGLAFADPYAATIRLKAQSFLQDRARMKFENRATYTKLLESFMKDREFVIPELEKVKTSANRVQEILYRTRKRFTIGDDVTSCTPTGETGASAAVPVGWNVKTFTIKTSYRQFLDNQFTAAKVFADDFIDAEISLKEDLDAEIKAFMEANKSQTNDGISGTFNGTTHTMEVPLVKKERFYNYLVTDMLKNNYAGVVRDHHNVGWMADQTWINAQGPSNDENTAFQFTNNLQFHPSNLLIPEVGFDTIHYIIPQGGCVILFWNDPAHDPARNKKAMDPVKGHYKYRVKSHLIPDLTYDVFEHTTCTDTSLDGGGPRDDVTHMEFSLYYTILKQPITDATQSPIFKYAIAST